MILFKKTLLMALFFMIGCSNATSSDYKVYQKNNMKIFAENYKVKFKFCSLKIPSRYQLIGFSYHQPNAFDKKNYPDNNFSYKLASFSHKDVKQEDKFSIKNIILQHSIDIANKKFSNINLLISKLQFIESKKISNIKVLRYKPRKLQNIDRTDARQLRNEELSKLNNILIVNEAEFSIIVNETDEYLGEIYKMIESCASQMDKEKK